MKEGKLAFENLDFGAHSAELEQFEDWYLEDGFYNIENVIDRILAGQISLILGMKGAGKTTIRNRLELLAAQQEDLFVHTRTLEGFPFRPFSRIVGRSDEPDARLPIAWTWLLALEVYHSFTMDEGSNILADEQIFDQVTGLQELGLLPGGGEASGSLPTLVRESSRWEFRAELLDTFGINTEADASNVDVEFSRFVEGLRSSLTRLQSDSMHIVVFDDLDRYLSERSLIFESLTTLIRETWHLNLDLQRAGVNARVLILMRTDIFRKLRDPNFSRILAGPTVRLNWWNEAYQQSPLLELANQRVEKSGSARSLVEWFDRCRGRSGVNHILEHTRYVPRDFIEALLSIQRLAGPGVRKVSQLQIERGLREYSRTYFMSEIEDEMSGLVTPEEMDALFDTLRNLDSPAFGAVEVADDLKQYNNIGTARSRLMLEMLYEVGALGLGDSDEAAIYRYMDSGRSFSTRAWFTVHRGWRYALGLAD